METTNNAIVSRDAGECDAFFASRLAVYALIVYIGELFPKTSETELVAWTRLFVLGLCGLNPQDRPLYTPDQIKGGSERLLVDWERAYPPKPSVVAKAILNYVKLNSGRTEATGPKTPQELADDRDTFNLACSAAQQAMRMGQFSDKVAESWWRLHNKAMGELTSEARSSAGRHIRSWCEYYRLTNTMGEHSEYGNDDPHGADNLGRQGIL